MTTFAAPTIALSAGWLLACAAAAIAVIRNRGGARLLPEHSYMLGAIGLLALAPCTYLLTHFISGTPSVFGSVVQTLTAVALFIVAVRVRRERLQPGSTASVMSFQEKSAVLVLCAITALFSLYFISHWNSAAGVAIGALVGTIILLVIVMIVGHAGIALFHSPGSELDNAPDERDREIAQRSMRNAYFAVSAAFWTMPVLILLPLPAREVLQLWFALLVVTEAIYQGSIVYYYRTGTV